MKTDANKLDFLTMLRGVGCLLVVFYHLGAGWNAAHPHLHWFLNALLAHHIQTPFTMTANFGYVGVCLFFCVSGFIITHVALRESEIAFVVKRILRIFPPLAVAVLLSVVAYKVAGALDSALYAPHSLYTLAGPRELLLSSTLLDQVLHVSGAHLLSVTWTLVIELLFYALVCASVPVLRRWPVVASLLGTALCISYVLLASTGMLGLIGRNVADYVQIVPLLLIGQITYLRWAGRFHSTGVLLLLLLLNSCALIFCLEQLPTFHLALLPDFMVSAMYAYAIFALALLTQATVRAPRALLFYGDISYSLYLTHQTLGHVVLFVIWPLVSAWPDYTPVFLFVVAICTAVAYLLYRLVERPSQQLARHLVKLLYVTFAL